MPAFRRDRVTRVVYAEFAVFGFFLYAFGPAVPLLRAEQGVSAAVAGLHGTALAVSGVVAGLLTPWAVALLGRTWAMRMGVLGLALGVVGFCATAALWGTLLGAFAAGLFGAVIINTHGPVLTDRHGGAGTAAVSEANAVAAFVGLLGPLAVAAGIASGLGWRAGLLALVALAAAALAYSRGVELPGSAGTGSLEGRGPSGPLPRRYWVAWIVFVLCWPSSSA